MQHPEIGKLRELLLTRLDSVSEAVVMDPNLQDPEAVIKSLKEGLAYINTLASATRSSHVRHTMQGETTIIKRIQHSVKLLEAMYGPKVG